MSNKTKQLVISALLLAAGLVLPFLTGSIPNFGRMLLPMHLPVLLCGFVCGWKWGLLVGFVTPLLRSVLFGMPPMVPTALAMAFELAAYGALAGVCYSRWHGGVKGVYLSLLAALVGGRLVWGLVSIPIYGLLTEQAFTLAATDLFWLSAMLFLLLIPLVWLSRPAGGGGGADAAAGAH